MDAKGLVISTNLVESKKFHLLHLKTFHFHGNTLLQTPLN